MVQYEAALVELEPGSSKAFAPKIHSLNSTQVDLEPGSSKTFVPKIHSLNSTLVDLEPGSSSELALRFHSRTGAPLDTLEAAPSHYKPDYIRSREGEVLDVYGDLLTHYKPDYIRSREGEEFSVLWSLWNDSRDLSCRFEVGQDSADLLGTFIVKQWREDLYAKFDVGEGSVNLLAEFIIQRSAILDLSAEFFVKQWREDLHSQFEAAQDSADLLAKFDVGQDSQDLLIAVIIRQPATASLSAQFEGQVPIELSACFVVRQNSPPFTEYTLSYAFTEGRYSPYDVMYSTLDDIGPVSIAQSEHYSVTTYGSEKLVGTSRGILYAVYFKELSGEYQVYVKESADYGLTWTNETRISTYPGMSSYNNLWASIAVDSQDRLHVVWYGEASGFADDQIWYAKYDGSWSSPVRISTYAGMDNNYQYIPGIAVDSEDDLHVVWYGKATGFTDYYQIWYVAYTGSWSDPVRISTYAGMNGENQRMGSIIVDEDDHLHVVWYGQATGYTDYDKIWYAKYAGAWATPEVLQSTGQNKYPKLMLPVESIVTWIHCVFVAGQASIELLGKFDVGQNSVKLLGSFKAQATVDLSTEFIVRHSVPGWFFREAKVSNIPSDPTWGEDPLGYPYQRKSFRAHGLIWITYLDQPDDTIYYRTSADGIIWSPPAVLRDVYPTMFGKSFAVFFDGTYMHYCYGDRLQSQDLYYRRGEPKPDGSIDWSAAEQVARAHGYVEHHSYPNIGVDKDGYPFIAFNRLYGYGSKGCYVTKSSTNDGTWITQAGFPYTLTSVAIEPYYLSVLPLPDGKVCVTYGTEDPNSLKAKIWDGVSSWSSENPASGGYHAAVNEGNVIHITCYDPTGNVLTYRQREADGTWSIEQGLHWTTAEIFPTIALDDKGTIWILWTEDDIIYWKTSADQWSALNEYRTPHGNVPLRQISCLRYFVSSKQENLFYQSEDEEKLYNLILDYIDSELYAKFESGQGWKNLPCEFIARHSASVELHDSFDGQVSLNLFAELIIQRSALLNLPSEFLIRQWRENLPARFRLERIFDLRGTMGIAFYWWGTGKDPEVRVDFILESPTGFWMSSFYDGPAQWRYVFLPWGSFTWFSRPAPDLDPHHHGFNEPDKSRIDGFYWTVHTAGTRRVDFIYAPVGGDLPAKFSIRRSTSTEFNADFEIRHSTINPNPTPPPLFIDTSPILKAGFTSGRQDFKDLAAEFYVEMITTYAVEGTGDITCPDGVETVLEGMTQIITGMKSGDVVILDFDCTLLETAIQDGLLTFRIKVDGVQIGKSAERTNHSHQGQWLLPISFMRRYVIPGDGDYTFTVTWYWTDPSPTYPPEINDGLRTLTIMHIH